MGEATSSWKLPLHSSDSEHPEMKRRQSKGKGDALRIDRGSRAFPRRTSDLAGPGVNASSVLTNPFDKRGG